MSITIHRTFHVPASVAPTTSAAPAAPTSISISEHGAFVAVTLDNESCSVFLSHDQFEALCSLRYDVKWDWTNSPE